ncbi:MULTISPECIES: hypothetical protein [Agrobacterium]|uniref:Uncharacterized protein n=2 Tax=Agrobacterium TaxID=357 RepID=A0ABU0UPB6_9HYPH|nr:MULTISPECIES: hypothetical protein [Agrobacterium]MDQ1186789.1 hypothetical protein [Agrobacterium larrymoorei]MDQ1196423.1 hypothetical protein [Rhizobium sp. SORGH_AS_0787]TBN09465.1 hypothetical protein EYC79_20000 [Agrobacterium cavarae]
MSADDQPSGSRTPLQVRASADVRYQYLLEEMKAARTRIDEEIRTMNQFEILSMVAVGLIYWLVLSAESLRPLALALSAFFPVLISGYGIFRYRAHAHVIKVHEAYIKIHIERKIFGRTSLSGLVKYYDRKKTGNLKTARFTFWIVAFCISLSLFVVCLVAPEMVRKMDNQVKYTTETHTVEARP